MLLAEDPATLINHTINNFNIQPDKQAVARINESLLTLQQARDLHIRDAKSTLRRLCRQQGSLTAQHEELVAAHKEANHASHISALDTKKFRTAKAASDAESETERLVSAAADLGARLHELEVQGEDAAVEFSSSSSSSSTSMTSRRKVRRDAVDDEILLRLKIYRSLGIEIERDEKEADWSRAVIRNDRKADMHVVNLDKKFSRFFYASYFWQML
ncbi:hypothetical protein L249_4283 [Ophiocordyceps polyrhachis-furcata BCC 54312]|uniref:Kinetochore protein Spc24 n=1 Tax=Ophiocordyceps polyrhachis-furcata BCC 54312 TaxID=1330021 RepID=A0A367L7Z5_9HYPO|nr:hypothetical protein L249_4283 [Ophiocordyceps polyrhachis-furcata BCC 54312]